MKRKASAHWEGSGKEGKGTLSGPSGILDKTPYSIKSRFENEDGKAGTNPEELIAAAHAGCFAMALSVELGNAGFSPEYLDVTATVHVDKVEGGFAFSEIVLDLKGKVKDISKNKFNELAQGAKKGCPVSKALSAVPIKLNITFDQ